MNLTLAALLGLSMAQPPASDYYAMNSRNIKLPIEYKKDKRAIAQVQLFVCENGDQVWKQVAAAPPTQDAFVYAAPADGLYWFHIVIVDMQGRKDPADMTKEPPAMKVLVDTAKPFVTFANAKRNGEEITVEWKVEDRYPDESATRIYFRDPASAESWKEVTLHPSSRNGVRFKCGTNGPVTVRVTVQDHAGNTGEGVKEIAAAGSNAGTTTSLSPGAATPPAPPSGMGVIPPPDALAPPVGLAPGPVAPTMPAAPSGGLTSPGSPGFPSPGSPGFPSPGSPGFPSPGSPAAPPPAPTMGNPIAVGQGTPAPTPYATNPPPTTQPDPRGPAAPTAPPPGTSNVLAVGTGTAPTAPTVEMSRVQVINYLRFELGYEVEQRGPSGISRVDLWVTRDDGRAWSKWSEHAGKDAAIRVVLDTRTNAQLEGLYGFRLVPVSGAGLSDPAPTTGDAPDMRVVVDITPPLVKIFPPESDPLQRDTLVINWEATDRNFGEEPITLEWSDQPNGPWHPIVTPGNDGVVQATAVGGALARRLPNTGRYPWRVPAGVPPKVYLKVTARDAAGNPTEVVTPSPILIDLNKPRAKIISIGGVSPVPSRP